MSSFYCGSVKEFLELSESQLLAILAVAYANQGYTSQYSDQTLTWQRDLRALRFALSACVSACENRGNWGVLLEFTIPRKERRIDVVLLIREKVVILEEKTRSADSSADRQIEEYSLLLHYFHSLSRERKIVPLVVSTESGSVSAKLRSRKSNPLLPQLATFWISPVQHHTWDEVPKALVDLDDGVASQIDVHEWDASPYFPVPSIIDAAVGLRGGLSIREIAHSEASEHEIEAVTRTVQDVLDQARTESRHAICFLTGVPGSGKTLVGLSLAHSPENRANAIHFMSGNGPLVKVLQHLFTQESMRKGKRASDARIEAGTLIENVHVFARNYTERDSGAPSNHAIIFDEAQRAWNQAQNDKKFKRDYSEPEMLLRIMERHSDWALIVALVGGGQEINDGEAGLEEWGSALLKSARDWKIYASPEVLVGGASTAGHRLFSQQKGDLVIHTTDVLHLRTSNRSLRAENLAAWVNMVIDGDSTGAASLGVTAKFPIFLTRNLEDSKRKLKDENIGQSRYGLVGSSGAARLRAEGLEPNSSFHADYPWEHWYLAEETDIRSSYRCEVFATEFEIQGLELDWIGVCWGGDFVWDQGGFWDLRTLRHGSVSRWGALTNPDKRRYRMNAYRVLLTRARQGMVIFVPQGSVEDRTNRRDEFDATADFLLRCGVIPLE